MDCQWTGRDSESETYKMSSLKSKKFLAPTKEQAHEYREQVDGFHGVDGRGGSG